MSDELDREVRMMGPRRVVPVVAVIVLAAAMLPTQSRAQQGPNCPNRDDLEPGPICADLAPPVTIYEVLDAANINTFPNVFVDAYWIWAIACGNFYKYAQGLNPDGTGKSSPYHATWSHNNAPHADNCSHDAPDHPGIISAFVVQGFYPSFDLSFARRAGETSDDRFLGIPLRALACVYDKGSAEGGGAECPEFLPPEPTCFADEDDAAVFAAGEKTKVTVSEVMVAGAIRNRVTVDFDDGDPEGDPPECEVTLSAETRSRLSIVGAADDDDLDLTWGTPVDNLKLGINLGGGTNRLAIQWEPGSSYFGVHGFPPVDGAPNGGVAFDFNGDDDPEVGAINAGTIDANLGEGDDTSEINWAGLKDVIIGGLKFNLYGGAGLDQATVQGGPERDIVWGTGFGPPQEANIGFAFGGFGDVDTYDTPIKTIDFEAWKVNLYEGADQFMIGVNEYLGDYYLMPGMAIDLDGGAGIDEALMQPSSGARYNFGTGQQVMRAAAQTPTAQVNLNSGDDDSVDVFAVLFEKWTALGSEGNDVFSGAGGHGTGDPFVFPLKLFGESGNDKLTGGDKADTLNGGPGNKDVCKGGKGKDKASGCETRRAIP